MALAVAPPPLPPREFTTFLFNKDDYIGEVRVRPGAEDHVSHMFSGKAMRVSDFSPPSDRCTPLLIMHSISSGGVLFTMDLPQQQQQPDGLTFLHSSCLHEAKTAMVQMEAGMELHLVAMTKRSDGDEEFSQLQHTQQPCFWGFLTGQGSYASCLTMLNLRCLGLVFDLDETLIVANTMRSFEDRMDALTRKMRLETDPERAAALAGELKRYQEDHSILKQYMENDCVLDNGKIIKAQTEMVPSSSDATPALERPIIRLDSRNIILTRINPLVRFTSVLVRIRPAWEELRSYLTAKGRKRFEVFICTLAEKDYALEMWRLLDPDARLIPSIEVEERVVCVKAGGLKSLANVFRKGQCHPRLSMVIDDRSNVWTEVDQPRVHVVPPFVPYYAPQAETTGSLPVLCIAKNISSTVRGNFFKEFDEVLSQQLGSVVFDTDTSTLPKPLDVSSYLRAQDAAVAVDAGGGSKDLPDGLADAETETIWNPQLENKNPAPEPSGENWEEGEVPESELDPDTRRRLLILQHGQDNAAGPSTEWDEEQVSPGRPGGSSDAPLEAGQIGGLLRPQNQDRKLLDYSDTDYRINGSTVPEPSNSIILLQAMARKYNAQLEFRSSVSPTIELQFCVEVTFNGEKIARGVGRTSRDARSRASEDALRLLSNELRDTTFVAFLPEKQNFNAAPAQQWNAPHVRIVEPPKLPTFNAVAALKDLCTVENLSVSFRDLQLESSPMIYNCEVEVAGQVLGRGRGLSWDAARQEASEEALRGMKTNNTGKRPRPRSPVQANKRLRGPARGQGRGNNRLSPRKQLAVRLK
ncbi:RNA polymerase II C-terminal domain phosphatase-like 1 isoform X1 [Selaginella moellendorffii]|uniref:RNA polymerase II C-terminal domain phosphatase-like 1 isoform X1 n=1 Tax=Selaginella moellendorffii TaxID=88036 RepID=UPI000D1C8FFC|nr:RNA polymerase II C-terminal domain phosphatase-like 1 isoform X1 [Selaginella moellendorffii]|eukprot:XP_024536325.1 RNA polymerase II C-terminal domain phosphatase-like 1 isoform X1 [Selaginella moellendorffii]